MSKANFLKVETALEEGLRKMTVKKLCNLADEATGTALHISPKGERISKRKRELIIELRTDIMRLKKKEKKLFSLLGIRKEEFVRLLNNTEKLTKDEWKYLSQLQKKTAALIPKYYPPRSDEEVIQEEVSKHKNKRMNINEKWLPLR